MLIRGVGKGSWWCYWAACRSRALWSLSKERGLATLHPLGACPPPQKLYLILRPCPLFPLATRVLAFMPIKKMYHCSLLCDGTSLAYLCQKFHSASTKPTSSHTLYYHLPAFRTIIHTRRASYHPLSIVSPASRCPFLSYHIMHDCTFK